MKKSICIVSSEEYLQQTKHAILSAKQHNPEHLVVLLTDAKKIENNIADIIVTPEQVGLDIKIINPTTGNPVWLVTGRPAILKYALETLEFDTCIFIDGDTYTYNSYSTMQDLLNTGTSIAVTPHNLKPLPNDSYAPTIQDMCLMGNYNSGVLGCSKKGLDFIKWWESQTKLFPYMKKQVGIAAEQGWLRFAADYDENAKVFRDPGYNVAYWNVAQRNLSVRDNIFYVDSIPLTITHFSGMTKETPIEKMSFYQNRYKLKNDGAIYKLYSEYKKKIWGTE